MNSWTQPFGDKGLGPFLYGVFNKTPCYAGGQQML